MDTTHSPPALSSTLARFRVDGRVAVVTGGAQGIGLAAAQALHEAGATVVLLDRDGAAAQQASSALLGSQALALDVADAPAIERVFGQIAQRHGRIDILVNNAGVSIRKSSQDLSLAEWNQVPVKTDQARG